MRQLKQAGPKVTFNAPKLSAIEMVLEVAAAAHVVKSLIDDKGD